jgi:ATP-dependent DNA helicase RecG
MEAIELIELIGRGEDSRTQFKRNVTNAASFAGEIVAFSNSKGGRILVGVSDLGEIVGLSPEDILRVNQLVSNATTDLVRPSVNTFNENVTIASGKVVMVVTVPEGISKPYADNNGVFWVKSGSDKRRVTSREELQRMLQGTGLVYADEVPVEGAVFSDLLMEHFSEFYAKQYSEELDAVLERERISLSQLLKNLGLAHGNNLNLSGLLLFGRNPQRYRPAFIIKAISFAGNDPAGDKYRDSEEIGGSLREMYKGTMSFLTRNLRHLQGEKGINTEGDLEIAVDALEELVVNMLLHRDYFISAPWRVMIFDDRIELISPGMLPNNLTVENIRNGISNIRNPRIVSFAIRELPYRGIGTGIRRALSKVHDLELVSDPERNLFIARIPRRVVD